MQLLLLLLHVQRLDLPSPMSAPKHGTLLRRHGNVASVHSRDCSVQRRHQKIVEEGPVTAAPPATLRAMEVCPHDIGYPDDDDH